MSANQSIFIVGLTALAIPNPLLRVSFLITGRVLCGLLFLMNGVLLVPLSLCNILNLNFKVPGFSRF